MLAAWLLWHNGLGWSFWATTADLLLTAFWVTGIVNAFNLMDNLDGAAASVAGVSALCVGILAIIGHDLALAVIALGLWAPWSASSATTSRALRESSWAMEEAWRSGSCSPAG